MHSIARQNWLNVRLFVRPSCCLSRSGIVSKRVIISSNFFTFVRPQHHSFFVPNHMTIFRRGSPNGGVNAGWVWKKSRSIFDQFLPLGNDTRQDHSYYGTQMGTRMPSIEWYRFQWPWVTFTDLAKYSVTRSIARPLCDSWATCVIYVLQGLELVFEALLALHGK